MYALIYNNEIVVGPREWSYGMFKWWFDEEEISCTELPKNDPNGPVITENQKIIPVTSLTHDQYDSLFYELAGPYQTIYDDYITGYYNVVEQRIDAVKGVLKSKVTDNRWKLETGGVDFTLPNGTQIRAYTMRGDRDMYLNSLLLTTDETATYNFKFMDGVFVSVNKIDLQIIVGTVANHVQMSFDWESSKHNEIDNCTTLEELKNINIIHELLVSYNTNFVV